VVIVQALIAESVRALDFHVIRADLRAKAGDQKFRQNETFSAEAGRASGRLQAGSRRFGPGWLHSDNCPHPGRTCRIMSARPGLAAE
jgi:hypothetical protein